MKWKVQLSQLNYDNSEVNAVAKVVEDGWITMGQKTIDFEEKFARDILKNQADCVAVSSCTAALHMSLMSINLQKGDEVIIPALTFVAAANTVILAGGKPILCDCENLENWNMTVNTINDKITTRTKAIMIVHFAGYPCNMTPILNLCKKHNLYLIEDVAHAPGAEIDSKPCGTWGDFGCFSFFSNKNLAIGEGGMIAVKDKKYIDKLKKIRSHGMSSLTLERHKGRAISYDVEMLGLNYRFDEIKAAIGLEQLKKLKDGNSSREKLTKLYRNLFIGTDIKMPYEKIENQSTSSYHILTILLPENTDRIKVINNLKRSGIQSSIHYPAFWNFSSFKKLFKCEDAPNVEKIINRELTLPLYPTMKDGDVKHVVKTLMLSL
jgi:dTDP-4-amino-4,6-dideoxygalactose transaminase